MTGAWDRVRGASEATFGVYVVQTAVALPVAANLDAAIGRAVDQLPRGRGTLSEPGGAVLVETFLEVVHSPMLVAVAAASFAAALVLHPWLSMTWLSALGERQSLARAARAGARRYLPAVALSVVLVAILSLGLALAAIPPVVAHFTVPAAPDPRWHDLSVVALCTPAVLLLVVWSTLRDLAHAALAAGEPRPLRALATALRRFRPGLMGAYVGWLAAGLLLDAAGHTASAAFDGPHLWNTAAVIMAGQLTALAAVTLRARWLATAITTAQYGDQTAPGHVGGTEGADPTPTKEASRG